MLIACQRFNEEPVGGPWEVTHDLDWSVVGREHLIILLTVNLPELRPSEVTIVDVVNSELCLGVDKVYFLSFLC